MRRFGIMCISPLATALTPLPVIRSAGPLRFTAANQAVPWSTMEPVIAFDQEIPGYP